MIIIKRWKEEMGKGYKEESMDHKKRERERERENLRDMKEEITDFHILALLL